MKESEDPSVARLLLSICMYMLKTSNLVQLSANV